MLGRCVGSSRCEAIIDATNVLVDGAGDFLAIGGYSPPATFGSLHAPAATSMFRHAFDASVASKSLATLEKSPYFFVAPTADGHLAVATDANSDVAGAIPTFAGQKLATPLGPSNTDALVVGVIGASSGSFVRGYAIPPFTRVQPGDPGSLRPNGIAVGADGRLVVVASLDGKVNLERCAVASDPNAAYVVILSIAP